MPTKRWSFKMTELRLLMICFVVIAIGAVLYRFVTGLGSVTNLNDHWPWGLWIGFDLLCGIALAGGGFSAALIVHVLRNEKFLPIARAALLTSMLGYIIALISLFIEIGRWYNFWRPFFFWGYHSVLFEVFWCIALYTVLQVLEFGDIFFEKVKCPPLKKILHTAMPFMLILGIILPTLHQSSLGSLFIITADRMNPLWWSMLLPFFFVWSAFFLGPAMVTLEGTLAAKTYGRKPETGLFSDLTRVTMWMLLVYLVVKIIDLVQRGQLAAAFNGSFESNMFLLELIVFVALPLILYAIPSIRSQQWGVLSASILVVVGIIFNRLNVIFTAQYQNAGGSYFPSFWEFMVTIGMWSALVLIYCFIVENFPILPKAEHVSAGNRVASGPGIQA